MAYRKWICAIIAACVCMLAGCAASNPTGVQLGSTPAVTTAQPGPSSSSTQAEIPEPEVPYFDLSLMPSAKKEEISRNWGNINFGCDLDWEEEHGFRTRFYGDFESCVVIWHSTGWLVEQTTEVADYAFTYSSTFDLHVYANGIFYGIQEAYGKGLLTQEQIGMVHAYHESHKELWEKETPTQPLPDAPLPPSITEPSIPPYPFEEGFDPEALLTEIPADVQLEIKQAFVDQFVHGAQPVKPERVWLEVFGIFEGAYAVCGDGIFMGTDALETEIANGLRFTYSGSARRLYIYHNGHWYGLQEAMDAQVITEEELLVVYENYYSAYPYLWGY